MIADDDIILDDVKQRLEIEQDTTEFDIDVLSDVNSAFFSLYQLGIGPATPFYIDKTTTWGSFTTKIPKSLILEYLYLKTKIVFDPPIMSVVMDAYNNRLSELEFRMNVEVDNGSGIISE
jgi:hypothetical protein